MADVEALRGLLERVRAAKGPDNRLRCDLLLAIGDPDGTGDWMTRLGAVLMRPGAPTGDVTESLDAALGLVGLALPGWRWVVHSPRSGLQFGASLSGPARGGRIVVGASDASAPLALCEALLKALLAQAEGGADVG